MSFSVVKDGIIPGNGLDSSGKQTFIRKMGVTYEEGDTVVDLQESNFFPSVGSVHPTYTQWTLESISTPIVNDVPREMWFDCTYSRGGNSEKKEKDTPPWELGPQEFQTNTFDIMIPVKRIFKPRDIGGDGEWHDYTNSAGAPLLREMPVPVKQISFVMNYKHRKGRPPESVEKYTYNSKKETVCNEKIEPYCGKMLPTSSTLHTVYENDGKTIKWQYDSVRYTIQINGNTWKISDLNVGTYCIWEKNTDTKYKGPVYKFPDWKEGDITTASPTFGSMEQLIETRKKYLAADANNKSSDFPWDEFTEPVPLNDDGTLDLKALLNKDGKAEYKRIEGFDSEGESWNKYDLPSKI